jgi:hypothetical protein
MFIIITFPFSDSVGQYYRNLICAWTICDSTLTVTGECVKPFEQLKFGRSTTDFHMSTSSSDCRRAEHFIVIATRHHRRKVERAIQLHAMIAITCRRQPMVQVIDEYSAGRRLSEIYWRFGIQREEIPIGRSKILSCGSTQGKNSTLIRAAHVSTRLRYNL